MTGKTTIEWATMSWNPSVGCTRVSAGCDNCYAFALHDKRYAANLKASTALPYDREKGPGGPYKPAGARAIGAALPWPRQYDLPFSRVQLLPDRLDDPLHHRRPERYFVDSMSDLFHEDVLDSFIDLVFFTMSFATWHTFLVLTKRPERMRLYMESAGPMRREFLPEGWAKAHLRHIDGTDLGKLMAGQVPYAWPPPNVWLGTSVEDQRSADERIPHLLETPAAVRFISAEPLLGPVTLGAWIAPPGHAIVVCPSCKQQRWHGSGSCGACGAPPPAGIDWVIVGGESGPRARPMDLAWARSLRDQCAAAGVACFVKQLGSAPQTLDGGRDGVIGQMDLHESHGRDMDEWPEDLRVREFPKQEVAV